MVLGDYVEKVELAKAIGQVAERSTTRSHDR
jgi:hypothetical protein